MNPPESRTVGGAPNRWALLKSRDLYRQAFEACPDDFYTGINAATKSLFLGEKETASQIAERVERTVVGNPKRDDYWWRATLGELRLLQRKYAEAAVDYEGARALVPHALGNARTTRKQALLILDALGAEGTDRARIIRVFEDLSP